MLLAPTIRTLSYVRFNKVLPETIGNRTSHIISPLWIARMIQCSFLRPVAMPLPALERLIRIPIWWKAQMLAQETRACLASRLNNLHQLPEFVLVEVPRLQPPLHRHRLQESRSENEAVPRKMRWTKTPRNNERNSMLGSISKRWEIAGVVLIIMPVFRMMSETS